MAKAKQTMVSVEDLEAMLSKAGFKAEGTVKGNTIQYCLGSVVVIATDVSGGGYKESGSNPDNALLGYACNNAQHWTTKDRPGGIRWNFNSSAAKNTALDTHLATGTAKAKAKAVGHRF